MNYLSTFQVAISGQIIVSVFICVLLAIICFVVSAKAKKVDPIEEPKGIMLIAELAVSFCDSFVEKNMGKIFVRRLGPYVGFCFAFIFLGFTFSLLGLPSPMTYLAVPLTLALFTFILIHYTSIRYTKWKYFERFVSPFPFFLPVNLISMWAPLISLSFRMFGNACAGMVLMNLVYGCFSSLSEMLFNGLELPIAAIAVAPILHAYFDIFSAFIQTLIFVYLSMLLVAGEVPPEIDVNDFENEF